MVLMTASWKFFSSFIRSWSECLLSTDTRKCRSNVLKTSSTEGPATQRRCLLSFILDRLLVLTLDCCKVLCDAVHSVWFWKKKERQRQNGKERERERKKKNEREKERERALREKNPHFFTFPYLPSLPKHLNHF